MGGTAAGITAVSAAGATAGLSAAGITSGLAAVGATVGGGMVAGSAIVIAAPAVAAAGVGYGVYRAVRRFRGGDEADNDASTAGSPLEPGGIGEDLSVEPISSIEFQDVDAESGRVLVVSPGEAERSALPAEV